MYDESPFLAFWETTRACELACFHCRASAVRARHPRELDTAEAENLIEQVAECGCRVLVLTGGDPMKRGDLAHLVAHATALGLSVALTPSATPLVTDERLARLRDAGLARLAISVDSSVPEVHDGYRGVPGSHARSLAILATARRLGLGTQINTTITRRNLHELEAMAVAFEPLGIDLWSVFFVVPTGRATPDLALDADTTEQALVRLAELEARVQFGVKTTAAQHFRRVLRQRRQVTHHPSPHDGIGRATRPVGDGQGIVFVSHVGDVSPSGFLPIVLGNVRDTPLGELYRDNPTMVALRDHDRLGGKCGACEWRNLCGGSRARAHAVHGDFLAEDPACSYQPGTRRTPCDATTIADARRNVS